MKLSHRLRRMVVNNFPTHEVRAIGLKWLGVLTFCHDSYFSPKSSFAYKFVCSTTCSQISSVKKSVNTSTSRSGTTTVGPTGCTNGAMSTGESELDHVPEMVGLARPTVGCQDMAGDCAGI